MVERSNRKQIFTIEFLRFEQSEKTTTYTILVTASISSIKSTEPDRQLLFQIKERYSGLLEFATRFTKQLGIENLAVEFPVKKAFGNTDQVFLQNRMQQLQKYFEGLMSH